LQVHLDEAMISLLRYPINENNNTIQFSENGVDATIYTFTLPPATYTGVQIATEIQTKMNAVVGIANTYTCSYNAQSGKLTIGSGPLPDVFAWRNMSARTAHLLGFDVEASITYSNLKTGSSPVSLHDTLFIDVCTSFKLGTLSTGANHFRNILQRIYLTEGFGSIQHFVNRSDPTPISVGSSSLQNFSVSLFDQWGTPYVLPKNATVSYSLRLS